MKRPMRVAWLLGALSISACSSGEQPTAAPTSPATTDAPAPSSTVAPTTSSASESSTRDTTAPTTTTTLLAIDVSTLVTAEAVAAALSRVELELRAAGLDSAGATAAGVAQQQIFRHLADHPEWDDAVIAAADPTIRSSIALTIEARRAVVAHAATRAPSEPPTTLPAWTIRAPAPATTLLGWYREAEVATGVPWSYLAAINFVETRFGRIVGASADGALGPMQFLPTTWAECCSGDISDDRDAILGAAIYLRSNGAPDDMLAALYAYNPNNGYVGAVDAYARNLATDERVLAGYHAWQVYTSTSAGSIRLPVGYSATEPIDAAEYALAHPDDVGG